MAALLPQFKLAKENVEPSEKDKANAKKAHHEVRELLEGSGDLCDLGIDTILIGSYARHVSTRRMRDVDVLSKLPNLPPDAGPRELLKAFAEVLIDGFGRDRVLPQDRSIKVDFPDFDLSVDVVPARAHGDHWDIPDRTERGAGWQETNPEGLGELTTEMNEAHDGLYVPVVKLIRQTRTTHLAKRPGGLYFEILVYHAFASGIVGGANIAEYYCSTLDGVVAQLEAAIANGLADPSLTGQVVTTRATREDLRAALRTFRALAAEASKALGNDDRCQSAKAFQNILGRNSDGEIVFPMPVDCKEDGTKRLAPAIVAGDRHVPAGDGRFA